MPAVFTDVWQSARQTDVNCWSVITLHHSLSSIQKPDTDWELRCLPTPPASDVSIRGHKVWYGKTSMVWLPNGKKFWSHTYYWHNTQKWQTARQTYGRTLHDGIGRGYAPHHAAKWKCGQEVNNNQERIPMNWIQSQTKINSMSETLQ